MSLNCKNLKQFFSFALILFLTITMLPSNISANTLEINSSRAFQIEDIGSSFIKLKWDADNSDNFTYEVLVSPNSNNIKFSNENILDSSVKITNLLPDTKYIFSLLKTDSSSNSIVDGSIEIKTPLPSTNIINFENYGTGTKPNDIFTSSPLPTSYVISKQNNTNFLRISSSNGNSSSISTKFLKTEKHLEINFNFLLSKNSSHKFYNFGVLGNTSKNQHKELINFSFDDVNLNTAKISYTVVDSGSESQIEIPKDVWHNIRILIDLETQKTTIFLKEIDSTSWSSKKELISNSELWIDEAAFMYRGESPNSSDPNNFFTSVDEIVFNTDARANGGFSIDDLFLPYATENEIEVIKDNSEIIFNNKNINSLRNEFELPNYLYFEVFDSLKNIYKEELLEVKWENDFRSSDEKYYILGNIVLPNHIKNSSGNKAVAEIFFSPYVVSIVEFEDLDIPINKLAGGLENILPKAKLLLSDGTFLDNVNLSWDLENFLPIVNSDHDINGEISFPLENGLTTKGNISLNSTISISIISTDADKSILENLINTANSLDKTFYTADSFIIVSSNLIHAITILENESANQNDIDLAILNLQDSIDKLVLAEDETKPNKSILENLINTANSLDKTLYTADSFIIVSNNLIHAITILENESANQNEIDLAVLNLQDSIDKLVIAEDETKPNKSILENLINTANSLDKTFYTADSFIIFSNNLSHAIAILENESANQNDIEIAVSNLQDSIDKLVLSEDENKPSKSILENLINTANSLDKILYTADSFIIVSNNLSHAITILENESANQNEIDLAVSNLQNSIYNLVLFDIESNIYKIIANPTSCDWTSDDIVVELSCIDKDNLQLDTKNILYTVTNKDSLHLSEIKNNYTDKISINETGIFYIYATSTEDSDLFLNKFGPFKIDKTIPYVSNYSIEQISNKDIKLSLEAYDNDSGIKSFDWQFDDGNGYISISTNDQNQIIHSNVKQNQKYSYRVIVTDNANNKNIFELGTLTTSFLGTNANNRNDKNPENNSNIKINTEVKAVESETVFDSVEDNSSSLFVFSKKSNIRIYKNNLKTFLEKQKPNNFKVSRGDFARILYVIIDDENKSNIAYKNKYTDVSKQNIFSKFISYLSDKNILNGYEDKTFRPFDYLTRGEICFILSDFFDEKGNYPEIYFPDIEGHFAKDQILMLTRKGVLVGYPDGNFKPNEIITYEELNIILNNILDSEF